MARITSLQYDPALRTRTGRKTTACSWSENRTGTEPLLVLRTYGSSDREQVDSVSQALEIDETIAAGLVTALRKVFPHLLS